MTFMKHTNTRQLPKLSPDRELKCVLGISLGLDVRVTPASTGVSGETELFQIHSFKFSFDLI